MAEILSYLQSANHWGWWIFAVILVVLEIAIPGAVFLWMGIAAGVVGGIVFVAPTLSWQYQFLIFAILSVVSVLVARRYLRSRPIATDQPSLNRRGSQYIGRTFTLSEPIVDGRGRLHVDDTMWRIDGPDLETGTKVTVVGVDGVVLKVEPHSAAAAEKLPDPPAAG